MIYNTTLFRYQLLIIKVGYSIGYININCDMIDVRESWAISN